MKLLYAEDLHLLGIQVKAFPFDYRKFKGLGNGPEKRTLLFEYQTFPPQEG